MSAHTVFQGVSLSGIADASGFLPNTIWNHGENAGLKAKRQDPIALSPGDGLSIPELAVKEISRTTDASHSFVKRNAKANLRLRLLDGDKPRG